MKAPHASARARAPRVLVAEDNGNVRRFVGELLADEGYETTLEARGDTALAHALDQPPDIILLDLGMPGLSGSGVLRALRGDDRTRHVPVVILSARDSAEEKVRQLSAGADDYVVKPFDADELMARLRSVLARSEVLRGRNPLTNLPGNHEIAAAMATRLAADRTFACLYVDLDRFKSFNDRYGFVRGDVVIAMVARVLGEVIREVDPQAFVGHVGGDDFVALVDSTVAIRAAAQIIARIDRAAPALYDQADRDRGGLQTVDRAGGAKRIGFVRASVGVVVAMPRRFSSPTELARVAAEVKEAAKRSATKWAVDRRAG